MDRGEHGSQAGVKTNDRERYVRARDKLTFVLAGRCEAVDNPHGAPVAARASSRPSLPVRTCATSISSERGMVRARASNERFCQKIPSTKQIQNEPSAIRTIHTARSVVLGTRWGGIGSMVTRGTAKLTPLWCSSHHLYLWLWLAGTRTGGTYNTIQR